MEGCSLESSNVAVVLAIANQKGGVGKTTTTLNLGYALAYRGKRVLLVDMDPQGNLTSGAGVAQQLTATVAEALLDRNKSLPRLPIEGTFSGSLHIAPANLTLAQAEAALFNRLGREMRLRDQLRTLDTSYDFILIDTPPSLGVLTINALVSAHFVIIPTEARFFSLEGLRMLLESIDEVRYLNPELRVLGIIVSKYDRRLREERTVNGYLRQTWGNLVFSTEIGTNSKILEAASGGLSIYDIEGGGRAVEVYEQLTDEVLIRG